MKLIIKRYLLSIIISGAMFACPVYAEDVNINDVNKVEASTETAQPSVHTSTETTAVTDIEKSTQAVSPTPESTTEKVDTDILEVLGSGGFNGGVSSVLVQSNGKVLVAGTFSMYGGVYIGKGLARLDSRGNLDKTFTNNTRLTFTKSEMYGLAMDHEGRILVCGNFLLHGMGNNEWQGLARFYSDGRLDTSFGHVLGNGFDNVVVSVEIQPDGKIIAVGNFSSYAGHPAGGVIRLYSDGGWDEGFSTNLGKGIDPKATIKSIAIQPDGKIILVGDFNDFSGRKVDGVVRLNPDGSLDLNFFHTVGASFFVGFPLLDPEDMALEAGLYLSKVLLQPTGDILLGGEFISYNSDEEIYSSKVLRLNSEGQLDLDFIKRSLKHKFRGEVNSLLLQSDGKILVGCSNPFSRLEPDGTHDDEFLMLAGHAIGGDINAMAMQPDGKIILAGRFNSYKGIKVGNITRLNPDGTMDERFVSGSYK